MQILRNAQNDNLVVRFYFDTALWVKYLQITPDRVYYKCNGNTD